jgi:hypothetical protein
MGRRICIDSGKAVRGRVTGRPCLDAVHGRSLVDTSLGIDADLLEVLEVSDLESDD